MVLAAQPQVKDGAMVGVGDSEAAQVTIHASPEIVHELLSDPTRMPQWSPEVIRVVWTDGHTSARAGARFRGTSRARLRWRRTCEVLAVERPYRFVFRTVPSWLYSDSTIWSFDIEPRPDGCVVTERYEVVREPNMFLRWGVRFNGRPPRLAAHLQRTLQGLKASAEQAQAGRHLNQEQR
jgi:uncharacterized protein YndB with AHSA1/START domain